MKTVAVIPARGNSKGVRRKNIRKLNGVPLIGYTILTALACPDIDLVIVSTEDPQIEDTSLVYAKVLDPRFERFSVLHRAMKLSQDWVQCDSVCLDVMMDLTLDGIEPEVMVLLQPTSPFKEPEEISAAINMHRELGATVISGILGEMGKSYLWELCLPYMTPLDHDPARRRGRQWDTYIPRPTLADVFSEDGAITVCDAQEFKQDKILRMAPFAPLERLWSWQTIDINTQRDWENAEEIAQRYRMLSKSQRGLNPPFDDLDSQLLWGFRLVQIS